MLMFNRLTFDVMGDLCFGKAFGMLERPDAHFAVELIGKAAHRHLICGQLPMIHHWHLDKVLFPKIATGRERYIAFSRAQAVERTKMGNDGERKDFFHYLLNAKDPETGNGFSMNELWGESNLLIIAGSDTSSTALAGAFFYLTHNPIALQRLEREILSTFSELEEIHSGPELTSCAYLRACIDEAMRMSPPVGGILPREVLPGGLLIDGHQIPAGTVVGVPTYAIHHNTTYFPLPFTYNPERWISNSSESTTKEDVDMAQSAFCPFSVGPRGCIGKGLAYTELLTALARTVFMYEMRLADGNSAGEGKHELGIGRQRVGEFQLWDTFTSLKDGPYVQFRARA
jgi:cytochrome P450